MSGFPLGAIGERVDFICPIIYLARAVRSERKIPTRCYAVEIYREIDRYAFSRKSARAGRILPIPS